MIATMILAVMTRTALGHTGRPLVVSRAIAVAYLLLTFTAVLRTFGVALFPAHYLLTLAVAAMTWSTCFVIFVVVYAPVLWRPQATESRVEELPAPRNAPCIGVIDIQLQFLSLADCL